VLQFVTLFSCLKTPLQALQRRKLAIFFWKDCVFFGQIAFSSDKHAICRPMCDLRKRGNRPTALISARGGLVRVFERRGLPPVRLRPGPLPTRAPS